MEGFIIRVGGVRTQEIPFLAVRRGIESGDVAVGAVGFLLVKEEVLRIVGQSL